MFFDRMYFLSSSSFFSSQNFKRGGALAPSMDAPPLIMDNMYYSHVQLRHYKSLVRFFYLSEMV